MHAWVAISKLFLIFILIIISGASYAQNKFTNTFVLNFTNDLSLERKNWLIVNDSVMGGLTNSDIDLEVGKLVFAGKLSLKNNGGFASVRRRLIDNETNQADYVKLIIKGDGRAYKIRFRLNGYLDGLAYEQTIQTKLNVVDTYVLHEKDFEAVYRSRIFNGDDAFDLQDALQFEIMLTDKNEGEFYLELIELNFLTNK
ncbi:CIA30 family protein [Marinicellulosiphila megalodicopiae]|uniref:CIA30 family protein n=1 Tax=Marinicellulosiphila megalodicopiae TaxID=2724896 RepID=UPI003BB070D9